MKFLVYTELCALFATHVFGFFVVDIAEITEINQDALGFDSVEDYSLEAKQCDCDDKSGCLCTGEKAGWKVEVVVTYDELERDGKEHILAHFTVNEAHFVEKLPANKRKHFCHKENGKSYCFVFKVHDDGKANTLPGCISMTKPVQIDLGCFSLPL